MPDYAEATAANTGRIGTPMLAVRTDQTVDRAGVPGDFAMLQCNSVGELNVDTEGARPTYNYADTLTSIAAAATDIYVIGGSASNVVKVKRVIFSATATAGKTIDAVLIKRSVANTGGTFVGTTPPCKNDSGNGSAPADLKVGKYTANPTVGASAGVARWDRYTLQAADTGGNVDRLIWDFVGRNGQPMTLRGVTEQLCVNLNGVTLGAGSVIDISLELVLEPLTA